MPPAKDENLDYALSYQNMDKFDKVTSIHDCLNRSIIVAFLQSTIFSHAFDVENIPRVLVFPSVHLKIISLYLLDLIVLFD